jgi:hypothetical protein
MITGGILPAGKTERYFSPRYARQTPSRPRLPSTPYFRSAPGFLPDRGNGIGPGSGVAPGGGLGLARWPMMRQVRSGQVSGRPIRGPRGALDPAGHLGHFANTQCEYLNRAPPSSPVCPSSVQPHPPETGFMADACAALGPLSGAGAADILVSIPPQVLTWAIGLGDDHPTNGLGVGPAGLSPTGLHLADRHGLAQRAEPSLALCTIAPRRVLCAHRGLSVPLSRLPCCGSSVPLLRFISALIAVHQCPYCGSSVPSLRLSVPFFRLSVPLLRLLAPSLRFISTLIVVYQCPYCGLLAPLLWFISTLVALYQYPY